LQLALEFNARTTNMQDVPALAAAVGTLLYDLLRVERSALVALTPVGTNFDLRWASGRGKFRAALPSLPRANLLFELLAKNHGPLRQTDLEDDVRYDKMPKPGQDALQQCGAEVYLPLFNAAAVAGLLVIGPKARGRYNGADLDILTMVGAMVEPALKAARALEELHARAESAPAAVRRPGPAGSAALGNDILTIISHELRTPITHLLGFADLLGSMVAENKLDARSIGDVTADILRACDRLNGVISQMLDMAQIDVDALDLRYEDTMLDEVLNLAVEPYLKALQERRLALNILGVQAIPPLRADRLRLAQAFSQLTSNAIKFTPDGGRIDIRARPRAPEGGGAARVELVWADSGIGIAAEQQTLVFQKFFRAGSVDAHSTSHTKFMGGGAGLGLAIAKGVIEAHGGKIWAESAGHDPALLPGSRFHVILPLLPPHSVGLNVEPPAVRAPTRPLAASDKKTSPFTRME
jgi:signal transduction histidine kinase